jgi:hypothetical protein
MQYPFDSATRELQRATGDPNFLVFFESLTQEYEVFWRKCDTIDYHPLTSFKEWGPEEVRSIKIAHWERLHGINGRDTKYYFEEMDEMKEQSDRNAERYTEGWAGEMAHDMYHATGKRVW